MEYFSASNARKTHPYMPILDAHIHIRTLKRTLNQNMVMRQSGIRGFCIQSLSRLSEEFATNNMDALLLKLLLQGEIYAFGGFERPENNADAKNQDYLQYVRKMMEAGFDGIKFYDAKPSVRKKLGMAIDCEQFAPVYAYMEEIGAPVMNHVGDPANFWDGENAPAIAKQYGWTYDSSYVHPQQYFEEITNVFKCFPKLKMILSHLFFLSVDMPRLSKFLDEYPNVMIDITPGTEMYIDFSNDPQAWHDFYIKYQDRIIFGTDNGFYGETTYEIDAVRTFLETDDTFDAWEMTIKGIYLPAEVCRKIYYDNFIALVNSPRLPDLKFVRKESENLKNRIDLFSNKEDILADIAEAEIILDRLGVV